jgi:hypothetical protein
MQKYCKNQVLVGGLEILCWNVFGQAYSRMLMDSWEPFLDFYKPALATSVNFQELTLGTVAPQFDGLISSSLSAVQS